MRFFLAALIIACFFSFTFSQKTIDETLQKFNSNSVDYITVDELKTLNQPLLFDTRKKEEFDVSHIKDAQWVGHQTFKIDTILKDYPNKNMPIVVYCSIGVRSENIGEKLLKAGYTNVKNLYGGIFEWVNRENTIVDSDQNETEKIHAFSKHWGKLLTNGDKVYKTKSKKEIEKKAN